MSEPARNLGDLLGARRASDALAIIELNEGGEQRRWRLAEIERGTIAVAEMLQSKGFSFGTAIGILAANSVRNLITYFGIMRAGCVCVPINCKQPPETVAFVCRDASVQMIFHDDEHAELVPAGLCRTRLADAPLRPRGDVQRVSSNEHDTALILYTSGSTGRPKGVVLSHFSQLAMLDALAGGDNNQHALAGNRGVVVAPMFHMNALVFIQSFLMAGGSIVLMPRFDAPRFIEAVRRHQVNVMTGDLVHCDEQGFYYFDGRADDMLVCSGENIYPSEVERVIETHRNVAQAAVVPLEDEVRGQVPVAFVVPRASSSSGTTELDIQEHVKRRAAVYMYPRRVWLVDALPLGGTSKVDRQKLINDALRRTQQEDSR